MAVICYRSRQTVKSKQMLCACTKSLIFCSFSLAAVCVSPSLDTQPGLASIELSFHPCNIMHDNRRGISRGNKNVDCGTWKWRFFALAVRISGKLLKIDGYIAARGFASTELSFHSCNVLRDCHRGVLRANKKWMPGYVRMTIFCICGSNNWETVVDRQLTH